MSNSVAIKLKRTAFRVKLLMTEEEHKMIETADMILRDDYGITRNDALRQFITKGLIDKQILFRMGFIPKKKKQKGV